MDKDKLHPIERVVQKGVEAFKHDLNTQLKYMQVDGRPVFTTPLTAQERIERYMNPMMRQEIIEKKMQQGGIEATTAYMKEMKLLIAKEAKKASKGALWPG